MQIRPKGWWPTPHTIIELTSAQENKCVNFFKNYCNQRTRYVTMQELRSALVEKAAEVFGVTLALPSHVVNALIRRADSELRQAEVDENLHPPGWTEEP